MKVGKKLKKNNVAVDIVSFGSEELNAEKLEAFVAAVNSGDNSHLVTVPAGTILADMLFGSPIFQTDGEAKLPKSCTTHEVASQQDLHSMLLLPCILRPTCKQLVPPRDSASKLSACDAMLGKHSPFHSRAGGAGYGAAAAGAGAGGSAPEGYEFGVDPNLDPELAMALRVSMQEERSRQEAAAASSEAAAPAAAESMSLYIFPRVISFCMCQYAQLEQDKLLRWDCVAARMQR